MKHRSANSWSEAEARTAENFVLREELFNALSDRAEALLAEGKTPHNSEELSTLDAVLLKVVESQFRVNSVVRRPRKDFVDAARARFAGWTLGNLLLEGRRRGVWG